MRQVVMSPGSRCAPLVLAFLAQEEIECIQIVDERSAAFFALGLAQKTNRPVGLVCTSGSAVLNYGPAVAEAFYQKMPLVLFTADRPNEWIDQGENQSINQYRIYNNYIKASLGIPSNTEQEAELWYSNRIVSEALNIAMNPYPGPVHVNIPLREPLYNTVEEVQDEPKTIEVVSSESQISEKGMKSLLEIWNSSEKKMIIAGGIRPSNELKGSMTDFKKREDVLVLTESISNLQEECDIDQIDPSVEIISSMEEKTKYIPDILITFGGGVVSKKLKFLLRKHRPKVHWHITNSNQHWDTFQSLTHVLNCQPDWFFREVLNKTEAQQNGYSSRWTAIAEKCNTWTSDYLKEQSFTDFKVFEQLVPKLESGLCLHLGNSTPVRYANLFSIPTGVEVFSNRGISGIDGIISTAVGAAKMHDGLTLCICGDLSFFYDSNAFWNKQISENFRVLMINNGGGNIFRIIPGPDKVPGYPDFFEAPQDLDAGSIAQSFGIDYQLSENESELEEGLNWLFDKNSNARILEVKTPNNESATVLREYLNYIKSRYNEQA